jgi:hypothetical protein
MKKLAILSTAALIGVGSIAASTTDAEARWRGHRGGGGAVAAGIIGGLAAGALIGAAASNAYAYPSYGYGYGYAPAYGYAPVAYGAPVRAYSYEPAYGDDYAPAYRTRVVRTRYAPVYRERVVRAHYAPAYRQRLARSYGPNYGYVPAYYGGGYYGGPSVSVGFGSGGY